jgi:hypothetical protein
MAKVLGDHQAASRHDLYPNSNRHQAAERIREEHGVAGQIHSGRTTILFGFDTNSVQADANLDPASTNRALSGKAA